MKTLKALAVVLAIMSPAIALLSFHQLGPKQKVRAQRINRVNNFVTIRGPLTNSVPIPLPTPKPQG